MRRDDFQYDQGHVVYQPAQMSADALRRGQAPTYKQSYSYASTAKRFGFGGRNVPQWLVYDLFMRRGARAEQIEEAASATKLPQLLRCRRSCGQTRMAHPVLAAAEGKNGA